MNNRLKILIDDGNQICRDTGIGKYTLYLYNAMKNNGCDISLVDQTKPLGGRLTDRLKYLRYINSQQFQMDIKDYDVVLFTNYAMPFRRSRTTKYAVTIPDMVAYLHPHTLPLFYRYYNRMMIRNTVKKSDIIFTISKSVEKEIAEKFPECKKKIRTTWLGLYDGICPRESYKPYENPLLRKIDEYPYFLFISTVEKRKNVGLVLDAFLKIKSVHSEALNYKFVIVGRPGFGYEKFIEKVNSSEFKNDVIFAGYTSDEDCNRLYNHAKAFVFPSVYEGFGFAQIECMKCHLPIILSNIPTNIEISRAYGEFFNLKDLQSLIDKMLIFVQNRYDYTAKAQIADAYLDNFDWTQIASQYEKYLYDIVNH